MVGKFFNVTVREGDTVRVVRAFAASSDSARRLVSRNLPKAVILSARWD